LNDQLESEIEAQAPERRAEKHVSLQTVERLSAYRRVLEELDRDGVEFIHSQQLADIVGVTPAQLRRDLASFGSFGNISRGYDVYQMGRTISRIMGTDATQAVALFGVGDLGRALLSYRGFEERGFHIAATFDVDQDKVGRVYAGRRCYGLEQLETVLAEYEVRTAGGASGPGGPHRGGRSARLPQLRAQAGLGAGRMLRREHRHLGEAREAVVPLAPRSGTVIFFRSYCEPVHCERSH